MTRLLHPFRLLATVFHIDVQYEFFFFFLNKSNAETIENNFLSSDVSNYSILRFHK